MAHTRYEQVYDGDWEPCRMRGGREQCCGCRLTHFVDYRIRKGVIEQRSVLDNERTYAARRRSGIKVMKQSELELVYLAGFFDGEGSITIAKNYSALRQISPNHTVHVQVGNTNPDVIKLLHDKFGGCFHHRPANGNCRDMFVWSAPARVACEFLKAIRPYVKMKTKQIDLALKFQATKRLTGRKVSSEVLGWREQQAKSMRQLNGRNIK